MSPLLSPNSPPPQGLGKTLQGITLLWTLLQNGHELLGGPPASPGPALAPGGGPPLARRVIIVCPTSLVSNWDSECTKWLKVMRVQGSGVSAWPQRGSLRV